ncbi:hypothetical protein M4D70_19110 [Brevibacillus borstelensis]|uniref:hypothetical protein n=1 Tax=Brevibacillus borstelensis TaxID=45462 RepID=UPI00203DAFAC|nr:hypothetical protein [Brevibacillus borstelensis]MCM3624339.1 hypothetical protein [Brevibacillus borstelensis]
MDMNQFEKLFRTIVSEEVEAKIQPIIEQVKALQNELDGVKETIEGLKDQLGERIAEQVDNPMALQSVNSMVDQLRKDIEFIHMKVSMSELEINRLKP